MKLLFDSSYSLFVLKNADNQITLKSPSLLSERRVQNNSIMKFSYSIDINAPREKVIELFINPDNLKHWQDGYEGIEHISGTPGETGAKKKMFYKQGKRKMELLETIISNNLPDEFTGFYQHIHMENTMASRFEEINDGAGTRYTAEIEYTKLNGFMVKAMAFLFPGMFKKQAQKWYDQFKVFAEKE